MNLTNAEKLIVSMLADVQLKIGVENGNAEFIKAAVLEGQTWALSWVLKGVVGDTPDDTPEEVSEVVALLDMWSRLERVIEKFGPGEKEAFDSWWGGGRKFEGFDGNNEAEEMGIANFLIHRMDRFTEFKDREINSRAPTLERYRKIYEAYKPFKDGLMAGAPMSPTSLVEILRAGAPR